MPSLHIRRPLHSPARNAHPVREGGPDHYRLQQTAGYLRRSQDGGVLRRRHAGSEGGAIEAGPSGDAWAHTAASSRRG